MDKNKVKNQKRERRHKRIRSQIAGTAKLPRLSVFRSNKYIYAQLVDDENGKTLASASSIKLKSGGLLGKAKLTGETLAKVAQTKGIKKVVFDRGGYVYTGKIKALAEGAREGGLVF